MKHAIQIFSFVTIIATVTIVGCTQKIVQTYRGPKLSKEDIAILQADLASSPNISNIVIRRVNGVDTLRDKFPPIEVLPGKQVIRVEVVGAASGADDDLDTRSISTLTFDALAGHVYRVRGKIEDGIGQAWVVDNTQTASAASPATVTR